MLFLPDDQSPNVTINDGQRVLAWHRSGRPWLVGDSTQAPKLGSIHESLVAVIGHCPITATGLSATLASLNGHDDPINLSSILPGSFILAISEQGRVRITGDRVGLNRIFYGHKGDQLLVSDSIPEILHLVNATIDSQLLASRLTLGRLPPPLSEQSGWNGIENLEPGNILCSRGSSVSISQHPLPHDRWHSGERQAGIVREYLSNHLVSDLSAPENDVSSDLSGGLDSTTLAFFAGQNRPITTLRWAEMEAGNDDAVYAGQALSALAGNHVAIDQSDLALPFEKPQAVFPSDQPYQFARTSARIRQSIHILQSLGSERHFSGHGGDDLFNGPAGYLRRLMKTHPIIAMKRIRGMQALHRWKTSQVMDGMTHSQTLREWWLQQARLLVEPTERGRIPAFSWGMSPLRSSRWATDAAVEETRDLLIGTAHLSEAVSTDLAEHQVMLSVRTNAPGYRQLIEAYRSHGIQLRLPFLDNQVVEAVVAVRALDAVDP